MHEAMGEETDRGAGALADRPRGDGTPCRRTGYFADGDTLATPRAQDAEHHVPSRPETVTWDWFPVDRPSVLTIRSGDTVRINALSHAGVTQNDDPDSYLASLGVERDEILQDVRDF